LRFNLEYQQTNQHQETTRAMNTLRKLINSVGTLPTKLHHQWWGLLNRFTAYEVEPFSIRYWWTRQELVAEVCENVLKSPEKWLFFLQQPRFKFYDERICEYSWVILSLSKLGSKQRFLDVGCVMNTSYCLEKLLQQFSDVHFLNLVSEPLALHGRISFHSQDIRESDLPKQSFDCITCISTLEHVGADNSYNDFSLNGSAEIKASQSNAEACWQEAFISLMELLSPQGLLLVSMPYGEGLWKNGEYRLGSNDIQEFYEIAARYGRKIMITILHKDSQGWFSQFDESTPVWPHGLKPAGANAVALIETIDVSTV